MSEMAGGLGIVARVLGWLLGGAALLYVLYAAYFFTMQRAILFPRHLVPPAATALDDASAVDLRVETAAGPVEAWLFLPLSRAEIATGAGWPLVVIAHGNGEIIDQWQRAIEPLRSQGFAVLLVEYPGYGRSAGTPSQAAIVDVFVQAYDAAVAHPEIDGARVLLFGRSVGGGVVAQLAARRPNAGMVLLSTFTSVREMAAAMRLPGALARDPFDTLAVVSDYSAPLLILHGQDDPVIPFVHAQRLHGAAAHSVLVPLPCGHNDCVSDWPHFWQSVLYPHFAFLREPA